MEIDMDSSEFESKMEGGMPEPNHLRPWWWIYICVYKWIYAYIYTYIYMIEIDMDSSEFRSKMEVKWK